MTYEQEYKTALEKMLKDASPEAIAICRIWHGEHFGERGWGGMDFVAMALKRAQQAVDMLAAEVEKLREVARLSKIVEQYGCEVGSQTWSELRDALRVVVGRKATDTMGRP